MQVKLPSPLSQVPDTGTLKTYPAQIGGSRYAIAQRHKITVGRLLKIIQFTPRSKIYTGRKRGIE